MSKKTTDIVAYLTWIGLIIALVAGDRQRSRFHLNQALVLAILWAVWAVAYRILFLVLAVATFGQGLWVLSALNALITIVLLVLIILGLVNAIQGEEKPLPLIGGIVIFR